MKMFNFYNDKMRMTMFKLSTITVLRTFCVLVLIFIQSMNCVQFELGTCLLQYLEPCSQKFIKFYVFSSEKPDNSPIKINPDNITWPEWIDLRKTNKMIIHGYGGNWDFYATRKIRRAYLRNPDTNVFIVDWGKLSQLPCYPTASVNTKQAGECTARFLLKLKTLFGRDFMVRDIHAVGFSLGAHVAAFASNALEHHVGHRFDRITGLDPALPFFASSDPAWKLDRTDANYVDIVHTNSGIFGKIEPSGHVDFYMNGGQLQPACINHKNIPLCSHILATIYFAESINSPLGFWGIPCYSYFQFLFGLCNSQTRYPIFDRVLMGEYSNLNNISEIADIVFVSTNLKPPFAMGLQ